VTEDTGAKSEPDDVGEEVTMTLARWYADGIYEIQSLKAENLLLRAALNELVTLKDGPRDANYEQRKPFAWDLARRLLAFTPKEDT
jgi:hypothetical protein